MVCNCFDNAVLPTPSIRQVDEETVLVNWVEDFNGKEKIAAYELCYWPIINPNQGFKVGVNDLDIEFEFVSVAANEPYSFQLMAKTHGEI